jgi:hypothetical protein
MEHQEVPNEEDAVETVRAVRDRSGDQRLVAGCRNPLETPLQTVLLLLHDVGICMDRV